MDTTLQPAPATSRFPVGFVCLGSAAILGGVGVAWARYGLPTPPCLFHLLTGYPCVGCGSTRMVLQLASGHLLTAIRMNPLVFTLFASLGVFWLHDGLRQLRTGESRNFFDFIFNNRRWLRWTLAAAALANWAFLIIDKR
jgi:hypothetical protein